MAVHRNRAHTLAAASIALVVLRACVVPAAGAVVPAVRASGTTIPDFYAKAYRSDAFHWPGVTASPANGLPMARYPGFGLQWNYVTVALYGLQRWSDWLYHRGGRPARAAAIKAADFLISRQGPDGAWRYTFPFTYDDDVISESLPAGWIAAQAQGNAISLLTRMYAATGDRRYLTAAIRGLQPFSRTVGEGGLAFTLDGHRLLAGYPTSTPSLTLEDYELALIGVADLAAYGEQAQVLLGALLPSFYWSLALYTSPTGMPYFDLAQDFAPMAGGDIDPASAQACAEALSALLSAYPSTAGASALAAWTIALKTLGLND